MKSKVVQALGFGLGLFMIVSPALVFAAAGAPDRGSSGEPAGAPDRGASGAVTRDLTLKNPLGESITSLSTLVKKLINVLMQIGLVVIVIAFLWAGFKYVSAFGDETKVKDAHKIFKYTVIGAAVLMGAQVIAQAIEATVKALQ